MTTIHGVATPIYYANMFLFAATIGFGTAFIASSVSANFFKWELSNCMTKGEAAGTGRIVVFSIDMEADIGWRDFTVTYLDQGAQDFGCFKTIEQGEKYPIGDYQDNSGNAAAFGMVLSWGVGVVVAMYTLLTMFLAMKGRTTCTSMVALSRLCALFAYGVIIATTVFWWMIEGKFGKRQEALVPRLYELALDAAETCNEGTNDVNPCTESTWHMDTPGWALALGITAMFTYPVASAILWWTAPRIDALNSGDDELDLEMEQANKPVVGGDFVGEKVSETDADRTPGAVQPEEKARAKDRRSAKTGVRAGGRAPSNTVQGDADVSADPMTYALQQGADEELGSQDDEDEMVYQNHQVHHNVINHSNPNHAHTVDDQVGRRQQQYNRGYSRGTSGGDTGEEQSYDERSEADFSETASSAQYYANNQGRSFMSASSQAESFDEYR